MTECVSFILPLIQSKKETSKVPRKMGLYWDCDPQKKENDKSSISFRATSSAGASLRSRVS